MGKLSFHSACALVIALALVGCALPPTGLAQNSAGNTPLTRPAQQLQAESGPSAGSPALRADSRPIKVDVSLVLVSVSVVHPLNREVVGLDKENFEVLGGKEKQVIRHFSGEDAPISLGVIGLRAFQFFFIVFSEFLKDFPITFRRKCTPRHGRDSPIDCQKGTQRKNTQRAYESSRVHKTKRRGWRAFDAVIGEIRFQILGIQNEQRIE